MITKMKCLANPLFVLALPNNSTNNRNRQGVLISATYIPNYERMYDHKINWRIYNRRLVNRGRISVYISSNVER